MDTDESLTPKQIYDRARYRRQRELRRAGAAPDRIEQLSSAEVAYVAGLIDGEGSIFVAAVGPGRRKTVYPIVTIAMTHRGVIDWLAERLAAGKVQLHNQTNLRRHPYMKPQYRTQLFGRRAQLLCRALLPYLHVKKEQARLVVEFPVDARTAPGAKIDGSAINELRFRLRDQINGLNHEGTRNPVPPEKRKNFGRSA